MSIFVVDIESDGPAAGLHSMVCFGAVKLDRPLATRFSGRCAPISEAFIPGALAISGFTREQHLSFPKPGETMPAFAEWLHANNDGRMTLLSDNPAFDWSFINYYMHAYAGGNPFGHSARRIGDFCAGLAGRWDASSDFKKRRRTPHTHDPVDDAAGNAEAVIAECDARGVSLPGVAPRAPAPR